MNRKYLILLLAVAAMIFLAGCSMTEPISSESTGIWNHYFVYPLSFVLVTVAHWIGDYGLSIIIVTVMIRLILLPLILKQQKSMLALQVIQPEMMKIQEKYKDKKDQQSQQKMQQEMMGLYQEHKVNPLGGCLPIFIQMPIILAFYHAIGRTTEIAEHSFLWFSLGQPDPMFILPVVAAITTYLQTKISMTTSNQVPPPMKLMMNIIPIVILIAGITLPAALALYWVIGNLFGIAQGIYLKKRMEKLKMNAETASV
ncbi:MULTISPECIES: membrane protein insertase YidC [Sutcliffiella]|uniref:membrane protein insertase YidC n=1 Tax=Sutcliffiella TaxID=2837511 RepID=UPI0022DD48EC|nr:MULTISPECIES: membrane protein insertase YidC [Sutcliffiella]MED4016819.1 membrane protein insertase YidC [Sutcliffiella cohnii]WBL16186.1 membrane protein insertase YidC [Sutcliffiella sp. NC1]